MAHRQGLVALALLLSASSSHAFFNDLAAPPNWTHSNGTAGNYKALSTDVSYVGGVRGNAATLNLGGRSVAVPVAYKWAATASKVAAIASFANPALLILSTAALAYSWYNESDFYVKDGIWQKASTKPACTANCVKYRFWNNVNYQQFYDTPAIACSTSMQNMAAHTASTGGNNVWVSAVLVSASSCAITSKPFPGGANDTTNYPVETTPVAPSPQVITYVPVTLTEFQTQMSPKVMPTGVPQQLPFPLPIDPPILNPSPDAVPVPRPMRIPQGNPVPVVPATSPVTYKTPVVDVTPTTTIQSPWRTDVVPKDIVSTDPNPTAELTTPPTTPPAGTTVTNVITEDLCVKNPEILACQKVKFEVPDPDDISKQDKSITFSKQSGWGGVGSCPAPRQLQSVNATFKFDMVCDFMSGIRPVAIAIAWFIGGLILLGSRGGAE